MTIQHLNHETVIRIPDSVHFSYLQVLVDYLRVKSLLAQSQATDEEITLLAEEAQLTWWEANKQTLLP